jgi:hypothetical protein
LGLSLVGIGVEMDHATPTSTVKRIAEQLSLGTSKSANTRLREWMLEAGKNK